MDCRKQYGTLFLAAAVFAEAAVTVEGETRSYKGRHFCPECGSAVFLASGDKVEVPLGTLDAPDQLTPTYEIWTDRRESWLPTFPLAHSYPKGRDDT